MKPDYRMTDHSEAMGRPSFGVAMRISGQVADEVRDYTVDRLFAERVVRLLNCGEVSAVHFRDILIDLLE